MVKLNKRNVLHWEKGVEKLMSKELVHTYIKDIANHLWEPGIYGHASVMVGAGFSKNAVSIFGDEQLPDWSELSYSIYEALYPKPESEGMDKWSENRIKKTSGKNVIKLAEEYKVIFGQSKLDKLIELSLSDDNYRPGELHKMLLELPWNDVFTTNYDTLLERTIQLIKIEGRRNYKIVLDQKGLPGSTRPRIIKLHGSIPSSKPYIMSEEDYRTYPRTYAPFVNTVQQAMLETQLCLIGFSGDDPNFTNWLGWLRDNMQENCPKIYLCGIFDNLSKSEKTLLENNNIIVVDLSVLLDSNCENRHEEVIKKFFIEINSYKEKREELKELPYIRDISKVENETKEQYFDLMPILKQQREKFKKYIALPVKVIDVFKKNLKKQFYCILRLDGKEPEFIILLYEFIWRMNKCFIPLNDYQAKKLEDLLSVNPISSKQNISQRPFIEAWLGINFALCNMYRQDGKDKEFKTVMNRLTENLTLMNHEFKSNYYIENSLYYLQNFDYIKTLEYLNRISSESDPEVAIKKAFLLSQLGIKDDAYNLLKKVSAQIAQMTYTNEQLASLIGYMNLCFRSINVYDESGSTTFSDINVIDSEYNVRNILNQIKDDMMSRIQEAQEKALGITKGFNPNSFTHHYGTTPEELEDAVNMSFSYLMFVDTLCLPLYSDHKIAIINSVNILSKHIEDKTWLWSYIIRTKDEKVYDKFFTRPYITYIGNDCSKKLFGRLINILDIYNIGDRFDIHKIIISQKCITDLLSRFALVVNYEEISEFVKRLIVINDKIDGFYDNHINSVIYRLSYFFNKQVLTSLIEDILSAPYNKFHLSIYFKNINAQDISEEVVNKYIDKIIERIKDDNIYIRDEAISRIFLLAKCNALYKKRNDIENAIWLKKDSLGLPVSKVFLPSAWEELPHPKEVDFKILIKNYLLNFQVPASINGGVISFGVDTETTIDSYIQVFYNSSSMIKQTTFKVMWNSEELYDILQKILSYINNEKKMLDDDFDIFGESEFAKMRLVRIGELAAIIASECIINNLLTENIKIILERIVYEFEQYKIFDLPLKIILESTKECEFREKVIDELNFSVFSKESKTVRLAFLSLNIIILLKENSILNCEWIYEILREVLITIPYIATEQSSSIFIHLNGMLSRDIFKNSGYINIMTNSLYKAFDNIDRKTQNIDGEVINDMHLLDSLYNLSRLTKKYIEVLSCNNIQIPIKLKELADKLMINKSPEVRNLWLNE
jgi:hypothetical protein